jgi:hypothetical protein
MPEDNLRKRIHLNALPEYEMKLLVALAAFLGRKTTSQASAALAMYLRQSADRILNQCRYYAHQWGMANEWEVLDFIYRNPDKAKEMIEQAGKVHQPDEQDVFADEE